MKKRRKRNDQMLKQLKNLHIIGNASSERNKRNEQFRVENEAWARLMYRQRGKVKEDRKEKELGGREGPWVEGKLIGKRRRRGETN